jgi:tetratricopeptide (TPR) repeat protein
LTIKLEPKGKNRLLNCMFRQFIALLLLILPCYGSWLMAETALDSSSELRQTNNGANDQLLDWLIPNITPTDEVGWEAQIMRAKLLAEWGNRTHAIRTLEALLAKNPQDPEALILLAALYLEQNQRAQLEALLPNLQSIPALQPIWLYLEGRIALWRNRAGQARSRFEAALQQINANDSLYPTLLFYRGHTLELLGRMAEVDEAIASALEAGFRAHEPLERTVMARHYLRLKQPSRAIHLLELGLDQQTLADPHYLKLIGDSYLAANLSTLALESYSSAIAVGSEDPYVYAKRAHLLRRKGDLVQAWEGFEQAIALGADDAALLLAAGINGLESGQIEAASRYLASASDGLPKYATAHYLAAFGHYLNSDWENASLRLERLNKNDHPLADEGRLLAMFIKLRASTGQAGNQNLTRLDGISGVNTVPALMRDVLTGIIEPDQALHSIVTPIGERQGKAACAMAFWLGEWYSIQGQHDLARSHFEKAIAAGSRDFLEYQAANWRLQPK